MLKKYVVSWCDKMDQRLIDFIKKHVEIGSDILMVKELLLNAGHDIYIVEEHINHVLRDKKVKEFIVKHVKIGTDIERIKQALLDAGYDIKIVEEHIEHALKLKKKIRNINILLAVSLLTLFLILVIGFFYIFNFDKETKSIEQNVQTFDTNEYQKNLEIFNQALIDKNISICEEINDIDLSNECKSKLQQRQNQNNNQSCDETCVNKQFLNNALISRNSSYCLEITNPAMKNQCEQILRGE